MILGFTGTRFGMTDAQKRVVRNFLVERHVVEFHHGDCLGADDQAAMIVKELRAGEGSLLLPKCKITIHPPIDQAYRAGHVVDPAHGDEIRMAKTHFARNRDIVDESAVLIGTPAQDKWQTVGGTWYTIEYARKRQKSMMVVWPNGTVFDRTAP
jgi:hypothetical protein